MDHCKPKVRPGAREESASPSWLAAPATQRKCIYGGLKLDMDRHYIGSVTATTHQEKRIIRNILHFNTVMTNMQNTK